MRLRYLSPAVQEFDEAVSWYHQRSAVAARRFNKEVVVVERLLLRQPRIGTHINGLEFRLFPVHGFPYTLVYAATDSEIIIIALTHNRRRPGYWQSRLVTR